ncbi:hypothetical protein [Devosia marina]|uniref:hypothetical protein n=1 Tax=Devosia marina TaxID=2683198 RepID=UPI001FEBF57B|nr:hypothetical protein [Devosia marina]
MSSIIEMPLVRLVAGFVIWSIGFVVLYAAQALGCAYGWGDWHRPALIAVYAAVLVPLTWMSLPGRNEGRSGALFAAALWANRSALLAALLVFMPVTFASLCS